MSDETPAPRTRFDNFRRNRTLLIGAVMVVIVVGAALLAGLASGGERRSADLRPRNLDIWMLYPEDRIRFAAVFYPAPPEDGIGGVDVVNAAGPLFINEEDILSEETFGAELLSTEVSPPESNPDFLYTLYTMDYAVDDPPGPYGVEVELNNAPYLNPGVLGDVWRAQFFAGGPTRFEQVIVAVAVPTDATNVATTNPSLTLPVLDPYRTVTIGEWVVYYYDTTDAEAQSLIFVEYTPGTTSPPPLDPIAVDRRR